MAKIIPFKEIKPVCSFCGQPKKLLVGEGKALICKDCLKHCTKLIGDEE